MLVSSGKSPRLCTDSRLVRDGDIFIAVRGSVSDGHCFIDEAVSRGARYIVSRKKCSCGTAKLILVDDTVASAALLAQASRGYPSRRLTNLAVTGTNGKTTVAFLVRSVIQNAGRGCGLIGTVFYDSGSGIVDAPLTTPDCLIIADKQRQMVEAGLEYMVIEASSHGLSQNRLAGVEFKAAAFTNLSGEHLDYHHTLAEYLDAKAVLFEGLSSGSTAILNRQSDIAGEIARRTKASILWYAVDEPADIEAHIESSDLSGTVFVLSYSGSRQKVETPLPGRYNVSNHLAAAGLCLAAGFDLEMVAAGLASLKQVPGRLERFERGGVYVLIDYAHTDDALKNVLSALKPLCKGKLLVVFGCGGDRDRTKRPRMAAVAEQLADVVIVTSDNPRTERPEEIIRDIKAGFKMLDSNKIITEPDRAKAIELAVASSVGGDIILVAGKGHETYQIIGKKKFDFSDKAVVMQCLERLK